MRDSIELKLKQASAVLGVSPKDLQNLVQFGVVRPRRKDSFCWFDERLLLEAKVAFYLKESLGTSTQMLARFADALSKNLKQGESAGIRDMWIRSLPQGGRGPVEVRVPIRSLAKELQQQLPRAAVCPDLPRGRKRPGWKRELARKLRAAARDLSGVTEPRIAGVIRAYRAEKKRLPEVIVGPLEEVSVEE